MIVSAIVPSMEMEEALYFGQVKSRHWTSYVTHT